MKSLSHSFMPRNHAKLIKATALKLGLMKSAYPYRPRDLWLCEILTKEERHITTFTKAFRHQIRKTKKNNKAYLFLIFTD